MFDKFGIGFSGISFNRLLIFSLLKAA